MSAKACTQLRIVLKLLLCLGYSTFSEDEQLHEEPEVVEVEEALGDQDFCLG